MYQARNGFISIFYFNVYISFIFGFIFCYAVFLIFALPFLCLGSFTNRLTGSTILTLQCLRQLAPAQHQFCEVMSYYPLLKASPKGKRKHRGQPHNTQACPCCHVSSTDKDARSSQSKNIMPGTPMQRLETEGTNQSTVECSPDSISPPEHRETHNLSLTPVPTYGARAEQLVS